MRTIPLLALLLAVPTVFAEPCLHIADEELDAGETGSGFVTATWSATIRNRCEAPYDGTLRIRFLDEEGEVLRETMDVVIVQAGGSETASRTITSSVEDPARVVSVEVELQERERPI